MSRSDLLQQDTEADFWPESKIVLISQAGGRESCSSFHTESVEGGKRGMHFCLNLPQLGGSCCSGGFLVHMCSGFAGWCGLTVAGHRCRIPFSSYTWVGGTERKRKFVFLLNHLFLVLVCRDT